MYWYYTLPMVPIEMVNLYRLYSYIGNILLHIKIIFTVSKYFKMHAQIIIANILKNCMNRYRIK